MSGALYPPLPVDDTDTWICEMSGLMSAGLGMPDMLDAGPLPPWDMGLEDVSMLIGFSIESATHRERLNVKEFV